MTRRSGRYIQADPIGLDGGSSPYVYADGGPVNAIDPAGLETIWEHYTGLPTPRGAMRSTPLPVGWLPSRSALSMRYGSFSGSIGMEGYAIATISGALLSERLRLAVLRERWSDGYDHRPGRRDSDGNPVPGQSANCHRPWE